MAKPSAAATLQKNIMRCKNFLNFTKAYLKKNNPIKIVVNGGITDIKELAHVKQKLKKSE